MAFQLGAVWRAVVELPYVRVQALVSGMYVAAPNIEIGRHPLYGT
jgi:hypothetical protein